MINSSGWQDLNIAMVLGEVYRITINVNPTGFKYNAKVELTDVNGNVLDSGSLANLAVDTNVFNNNQDGKLLVYIQAQAGGAEVAIDNVMIGDITAVPEPATAALLGGAASLLLVGLSRSRQRARTAV